MIREHLDAFQHNNAIMRSFKLGWFNVLRGVLCLLPPMTWISLIILALALGYRYMQRMQQGSGGVSV